MKQKNLIIILLLLRLTYYRRCILERLRRFKLLIFFVLAMVVPSISFMLQVVQMASMGLMNGMEHSSHSACFVNFIIFQLVAMIWVSSQYQCLRISDIENYLRTLEISDIHFLLVELVFSSVINVPFVAFLMIGGLYLISKHLLLLGITHFIYLFGSLLFLSICLIFSRTVLVALLIITDWIFIYFNGSLGYLLSALILGMTGYFIVIKRTRLPLNVIHLFSISRLHLSRFSPDIYLNLKNLLVWNKVYTTCIFSINLLAIFIMISYTMTQGLIEHPHMSFLLTLNIAMFFCSLLTYKISETRQEYGDFFSIFHTRLHNYLFDFITIYVIALFNFIVMLLVGFYLDFTAVVMLKSLLIATISIVIFVSLNRQFSCYGPVISLLALAGILMSARGLL
jgi:hypothetical protein